MKYNWHKSYTKQEILDLFVDICKNGTSRDSRICVQEGGRLGLTYEEMCEYKRNKEK